MTISNYELTPQITSRPAEIQIGRRVLLDPAEALKSIGVFSMFVPRNHRGLELDLPAGVEVIGALGRIESSVSWTARSS